MGRHAEGWKLRLVRGVYQVRFTHQGTRHTYSTRESDAGKAARKAAEIYSRVIGGVEAPRLHVASNLEDALSMWLSELESNYHKNTVSNYTRYAARWLTTFETFTGILNSGRLFSYTMARLRKVLRKSVKSELGALSNFLVWSKRHGLVVDVPEMPEIPRKVVGVRAGNQRTAPVQLSPDDVERLIEALPIWSPTRGPAKRPIEPAAEEMIRRMRAEGVGTRGIAKALNDAGLTAPRGGQWTPIQVWRQLRESEESASRYLVRPYFEFAYLTGLRPSTIQGLKVPTHWRRGSAYLEITDDIDKARFGRRLPLDERARAILETYAPESGQIFKKRDYWKVFKRVALAEGFDAGTAPYDLRHARATHLTEGGSALPAVAYLLGHRRMTTTNIYAKPNLRAAEAVIWGSDSGIQRKRDEK